MVEGEERMTRDELKEKLWQELDRQDQVGCLHMDERVERIMDIVVDTSIDWNYVSLSDFKKVPMTLVEKVCE
jgi:hypothetical protein